MHVAVGMREWGGELWMSYLILTACFGPFLWLKYFSIFLCCTDFKNLVQHADVAIDIV